MRVVLLAVLILFVTSTIGTAGSCDRYRFGSQEWWQCKTNESSGGN